MSEIEKLEKPTEAHIERTSFDKPEALEEIAKEATAIEHSLTTLEAVKAYPMAIFWCLMVSMCVVMEGYDTIL